jgi:two-component system sensor histidine kinase KdpD
VEELLDAGIDVLTTLNVQHVESLNDVVAQITHVQVRETVPDSVLDRADAIELVDIAPEELLRRLEEGKVYLPDQARRASKHFFLRGNLLSLRELALRRTAQHVDEDVREYREEHGVSTTWPAGERILVCVGPAPSSGRLIRAAARMATGLRCPWVAGYVESTALDMMSDADRERLEAHLRVAESLGGSVTRLTGLRVSEALLTYARRNNVTRIIIGKPTHSRLRDRLGGSLLDDVVRGSGEIDVHVISGDDSTEARAPAPPPVSPRVPPEHYLAATAIVGVTLGVAMLLRELFQLPDLEMLFLLAVMAVAGLFGQRPAVLAAALGVACYDFFFVPPFHTFSVEDRRYLLTFGMMFAVGLVMSELATRLRRQERLASGREERTAALYALTRELASAEQPQDIAASAARHVAHSFRRAWWSWRRRSTASSRLSARRARTCPSRRRPGGGEVDLRARSAGGSRYGHPPRVEGGGHAPAGRELAARRAGVGTRRARGPARGPARPPRRLLEAGGRLTRARAALRRGQGGGPAGPHRGDALVLLSAVSHDLRTPLASITGAATVLRDEPNLEVETKSELVESIVDQAERLERLVGNLLDMTKLESAGIALRKDWVPLDEIIGSALTRLETRLGDRAVNVDIAPDVPLVFVDPVLLGQLFLNLLENAIKYTPPSSAIGIRAMRLGEQVAIDVYDHGPGMPAGAEEAVFDKFFRGGRDPGRTGTIHAENRPEGRAGS